MRKTTRRKREEKQVKPRGRPPTHGRKAGLEALLPKGLRIIRARRPSGRVSEQVKAQRKEKLLKKRKAIAEAKAKSPFVKAASKMRKFLRGTTERPVPTGPRIAARRLEEVRLPLEVALADISRIDEQFSRHLKAVRRPATKEVRTKRRKTLARFVEETEYLETKPPKRRAVVQKVELLLPKPTKQGLSKLVPVIVPFTKLYTPRAPRSVRMRAPVPEVIKSHALRGLLTGKSFKEREVSPADYLLGQLRLYGIEVQRFETNTPVGIINKALEMALLSGRVGKVPPHKQRRVRSKLFSPTVATFKGEPEPVGKPSAPPQLKEARTTYSSQKEVRKEWGESVIALPSNVGWLLFPAERRRRSR